MGEAGLESAVRPLRYDVVLQLHLDEDGERCSFKGSVEAHISLDEARPSLSCHALALDVLSASLRPSKSGNDGQVRRAAVKTDLEAETVTATFDGGEVVAGEYVVRYEFAAPMRDTLMGLYRSKYIRRDGRVGHLAVTQMEPTDCRRMFPCWDEPARKAVFSVTVELDAGLTVLSNMPARSRTPLDDGSRRERVEFEDSPPMSSYLVALVAGELDSVEATAPNGVRVAVHTVPGRASEGDFALRCACEVLPFFDGCFRTAYPLPKLDLVAAPDFAAGAMENWGLVTYRESALLVTPDSPEDTRQWVATVVAHELAHQWFGNLVTMRWWNNLWLNEGFASFMEYLGCDRVMPHRRVWEQFVALDLVRAMDLDSQRNSHPVEVEVRNSADVNSIFDAISYSKGSAVIRMLFDFLGADTFYDGVALYLYRHKYGNTETEDLWNALGEVSGKPVRRVMDGFVQQTGFPLVSVRLGSDKTSLVLSQQRFAFVEDEQDRCDAAAAGWVFEDDGASDSGVVSQGSWVVPLAFALEGGGSELRCLLEPDGCVVPLPTGHGSGWAKANRGFMAFCSVKYDDPLLERLLLPLGSGALPPSDRLELLSGQLRLALAGHSSVEIYLRMVAQLKHERDANVLKYVAGSLSVLGVLSSAVGVDSLAAWREYAGAVGRRVISWLGLEERPGEDSLEQDLRATVLALLVDCEDEQAHAYCTAQFASMRENFTATPAQLRSSVLHAALMRDQPGSFTTVLDMLRTRANDEQRETVFAAFSGVSSSAQAQELLEMSLTPAVKPQSAIDVLVAVARNPKHSDAAQLFLRDRWSTYVERYEGMFMLDTALRGVVRAECRASSAHSMASFFAPHRALVGRPVRVACEGVLRRASFVRRHSSSMASLLRALCP